MAKVPIVVRPASRPAAAMARSTASIRWRCFTSSRLSRLVHRCADHGVRLYWSVQRCDADQESNADCGASGVLQPEFSSARGSARPPGAAWHSQSLAGTNRKVREPRIEEMATPEVMPSHRIQRGWKEKLKAGVPFGLGQAKPKHFRDMAVIAWRNRDNLSYAWKVLSRGVCDGCALGVAGFHDWTIDGIHLCMTRLNLLRLNTMSALDVALLADVEKLNSKLAAERRAPSGRESSDTNGLSRCSALQFDNAQLRELGRLPYPMLREKDAKGFRRITWDEAIARLAEKIRASNPRRIRSA